jgi:hypothetical protein
MTAAVIVMGRDGAPNTPRSASTATDAMPPPTSAVPPAAPPAASPA